MAARYLYTTMYSRTLAFLFAATAFAQPKSFDVASIKPNASNDHRIMIRFAPGGFSATGMTVRMLIAQAYGIRDFQIQNAPAWIASERFDINAKAEGLPERVPRELMQTLLQNLLAERFGFKAHYEDKEGQVYNLVVAKGGPKLKVSEAPAGGPPGAGGPPPGPGGPGGPQRGMIRIGRGQFNATGADMAGLTQMLAQMVGRPVLDKTELKGNYDIELKWTPEPGQGVGGPFGAGAPPLPPGVTLPPVDPNGPTLFTALQEQIGLKLDSAKGSVQTLMVDGVSKPTEN